MDISVEISGGGSAEGPDEGLETLVHAIDGLDVENPVDHPLAAVAVDGLVGQAVLFGEQAIDGVTVGAQDDIGCELAVECLEKIAAANAMPSSCRYPTSLRVAGRRMDGYRACPPRPAETGRVAGPVPSASPSCSTSSKDSRGTANAAPHIRFVPNAAGMCRHNAGTRAHPRPDPRSSRDRAADRRVAPTAHEADPPARRSRPAIPRTTVRTSATRDRLLSFPRDS